MKEQKFAWEYNLANIIMHKSGRKNAKCTDLIMMRHLITKNEDEKLSDKRILEYYAEVLSKIIYNSLCFNKRLELTVYSSIGKEVKENNFINNHYDWHRVRFKNIEACAEFLFTILCLIYPYNHLDFKKDVLEDSSVKWYLNKWNV